MKKKVFTVLAAFLLISSVFAVDCFEDAFNSLAKYEKGLGFELTMADATEFVNESYAACFCLNNASHDIELDACFGKLN